MQKIGLGCGHDRNYILSTSLQLTVLFFRDLNKLEDGIGEKVVLYVHFIGAFLGSLILALVKGWELALICLISLPVTAIIMGIVAFLSAKLSKNELDAYAKAGSIAEEVLGSIRTVVAFGGEKKEIERLVKSKSHKQRKTLLYRVIHTNLTKINLFL